MAGEKEKGQSRDPIQFSEGTQHDHESGPYVFLFLYQYVSEDNDSGDTDIELRHEKRGKQLMGAEPIDKDTFPLDPRQHLDRPE